MIVVIDYNIGNTSSIVNTLSKMGVKAKASAALSDIEKADKLILPGVGAFDTGMRNLLERNMVCILNNRVVMDKVPILGICLGMQLMTMKSQEATTPGLGWLDAETALFKFNNIANDKKIPHIGWNSINVKKENVLFNGIEKDHRFYFLHSYHVICNNKEDILATTFYGYEFVCAINKNNIYGIQFHPEKSHKFGMEVLKNFVGV